MRGSFSYREPFLTQHEQKDFERMEREDTRRRLRELIQRDGSLTPEQVGQFYADEQRDIDPVESLYRILHQAAAEEAMRKYSLVEHNKLKAENEMLRRRLKFIKQLAEGA